MSTSLSVRGNEARRVTVGRIVGAHGVKGTLKINPLTDYPDRFLDMGSLYVEKKGKPSKVLEITEMAPYEGKGGYLARVAGVDDRDSAEALSGYDITVLPEERVELPDGEFWIDSLVGLEVREASGEHDTQLEKKPALGVIEDVMPTGGNDVYIVRTQAGELKPIPAIADVVKDIDLDAGVVWIVLPEGLWD